jgi:Major Facilitator Superfamily
VTLPGPRRTPGDRPLPSGQAPFVASGFTRLARTHALSTASDAMVATALAGTIFFEGATSDARGKVFAYLLLTMAPFAVVSPLIGPVLDRMRSGRRWMIIGSAALRALLCFFMIRDVDNLLFYPEAFLVLVLQKSYAVARAALVPSTVQSDSELVEANSKLSLISGLMGFVGVAPAALLFKLFGPQGALGLATISFAATAVVGLKLPSEPVTTGPADAAEKAELRTVGVLLAATAMGLIRGIVGFLTLLLAFDFRQNGVPKWHFGVVAGVSVLGALAGSALAPRIRKFLSEEQMLISFLLAILGAGLIAIVLGDLPGACLLGGVVGISSTAGKMAFDSIVQRDAPDANRGRSFAKFETRFQIIWVLGALFGLIAFAPRVGFLLVSLGAGVAAFLYGIGSLAWRHRTGRQRTRATETAVVIDDRITEVQAAAKRGIRRSATRMRERMAEQRRRRRGGAPPPPPPPAAGPASEPDIEGPIQWADDPPTAADGLPFDDPDPFDDLPSFADPPSTAAPPAPPPPPDPVEQRPPPPPPGWRG